MKVGDWVEVQEGYSPGRCSEGGLGSIIHIHHGAGPEESGLVVEGCSLVGVKYMLTGWVERKVPLTRLLCVPFSIKKVSRCTYDFSLPKEDFDLSNPFSLSPPPPT